MSINSKISFYTKGIKNKSNSSEITIESALKKIASDAYKETIERLRAAENDSVRKVLKTGLDYFTFSGTFKSREVAGLKKHSGVICIDFDDIENIDEAKEAICIDPYTLACFISPSGKGLKVLVKISGDNHLPCFQFLETYYKGTYNLEVDKSGKDVSRACFVSYDPLVFINEKSIAPEFVPIDKSFEAEEIEKNNEVKKSEENKSIQQPVKIDHEKEKNLKRLEHCVGQIENGQIDITYDYNDWLLIGFSMATFGEEGRSYFQRISQFNEQYNEADVNEKFDNAIRTMRFKTPAKFFSICKDYSIDTQLPKQIKEQGTEIPDDVVLPEDASVSDYKMFGFWESKGQYHTINHKGQVQSVSNFLLRILYHVESSADAAYRLVEIKNIFGHSCVINLNTDDFVSVASFKKVVARKGNFIFKGGDVDLCRLQDKLQREEIKTDLIDCLGYHKSGNFYAFANGIFDCQKFEDGTFGQFRGIDEFGIVRHVEKNYFIPAMSKMFKDKDGLYINEKKFIYKEADITLEQWADLYCTVYGDNGKIALIFVIMALFRDIVYKALARRFPILDVYGKRGSGKGALIGSTLKLFGEGQDQIMLGGSSTVVGFMRKFAQMNNSLVWLDEYKNNLKPFFIESLKNIYDGIGYERGKKDNTFQTESTPISSACMLSGQEMPTIEPALFTRCILLILTETKRTEEQREKYKLLGKVEEKGISAITASLLKYRSAFQKHYKDLYDREFSAFAKSVKSTEVDERMIANYASLIATATIICKHEKLPFTVEDFKDICRDNMFRQNNILLGSDDSSKFWEVLEFFYNQNPQGVVEGTHFQLEDGYLYLRLQDVYGLYAKELRSRGDANMLGKTTLENYLESDTNVFLGKQKKYFKNGSYTWTWKFKYDKLGINLIRETDLLERKRIYENMGMEIPDTSAPPKPQEEVKKAAVQTNKQLAFENEEDAPY